MKNEKSMKLFAASIKHNIAESRKFTITPFQFNRNLNPILLPWEDGLLPMLLSYVLL